MTSSTIKWKIEGDYFEGCNCDSICPCIFNADPDEGYCNVTAAWHIQKGVYNDIVLDGLNIVALFHTPGNMLGVKAAPIEFGIEGKRRWLHIRDLLELQIEGTAGADPNQEAVIVNPAFSAVPGSNLVIAQSSKYSYNDHGMHWDSSGRNGFYCKFKYTS